MQVCQDAKMLAQKISIGKLIVQLIFNATKQCNLLRTLYIPLTNQSVTFTPTDTNRHVDVQLEVLTYIAIHDDAPDKL